MGVDIWKGMRVDAALKDLVWRGHKCDNGFRSGYLTILENHLVGKFPGTDLKEEPHINSKIHVWKRQYVCLKSMLGISGVGLNSTTYHVEALHEVWESQIKVDPFTKSLTKHSLSTVNGVIFLAMIMLMVGIPNSMRMS
ncbi:hypothetical protein ACS0TY_004094 [Phlomoides rotata]